MTGETWGFENWGPNEPNNYNDAEDYLQFWNNGSWNDLHNGGWLYSYVIEYETGSEPSDGLVDYYPFNGNANDESGNGHNGTVHGPAPTQDRFGNPNSAYVFDGIDDYINVAGSSDFSLSSWTIAGWIKINDNPGNYSSNIVGKMSSIDHYNFQVSFWPVQWQYLNAIASGYETCDDEFDHPLFFDESPLHEWIFFANVRGEDSGRHSLYINGEEVDHGVWTDSPCLDDTDLRIGHKFEPNSSCFTGAIDDIRIYNRALSETEIQELFDFTPEPPEPPLVEIDLDLKKFKIRKNKVTGRTVTWMKGIFELPELGVVDSDTVNATISIQLHDVLEDGGDVVISNDAELKVKDRNHILMLRK